MIHPSLSVAFDAHDIVDPDERKKIIEVVTAFCEAQRRHFSDIAHTTDGHRRMVNLLRANGFEMTIKDLNRPEGFHEDE